VKFGLQAFADESDVPVKYERYFENFTVTGLYGVRE
jgi:hypothetical protein